MLCPNCEAENRDDAAFCDECGFPLSGAIARAAGSASPVSAAAPRREARVPVEAEPAVEQPAKSAPDVPAQGFEAPAEPSAAETAAFAAPSSQPSQGAARAQAQPQPSAPAQARAQRPASVPDQGGFAYGEWPPVDDIDASGEPQAPAEEAARIEEDPYAGYFQSSDDGFAYDADLSNGPSEFTMQMPRVDRDREPKPARRDFRIAGSNRDPGRARKAAIVVAGVVVGVVLAAVVTYLLGLWGGIAVPDVTGMTEADARAALEQEGFTVRSSQVKSDDTEGLVIITDPEAGARAGEGSEVVIHIATARFVPDIVGKNADDAKALLEGSGYENVRYDKEKSEGEENIVLSVTPDAGTRAKSNAEIVVKVSEGYSVPDISGLDLAAAEQKIADDGLTYGVTYVDTDQYADGTILGTTPEAGTKVEKESYVSISVARRRGAELVSLTQSMFAAGQTVTIGGVDYQIESVDSVEYEGDDTVSFTVTALPTTTFFGKTIYADEQVVSGQVLWSEDNEVVSIS